MIETLSISNYALIDSVEVEFHPGLNIITGETGAGKSIMLGALSLILGGRADTRSIRQQSKKSVIEATFNAANHPMLRRMLEESEIEWQPDGRCTLRREISCTTGRSRAFVNDSPVSLATLSAVAEQLIDIHSQHQNQLLLRPDFQLKVLDSLAGNRQLLEEHSRRYEALRHGAMRVKSMRAAMEREKAEEDYLRHQFEQLDELHLEPGEQSALENEQTVLNNTATYKEAALRALNALQGDERASDNIADALSEAGAITRLFNPEDNIQERLENLRIEVRDIADTIADVYASLSPDPARLEYIDQRLSTIYSLQRKHKADSVEALIELRDNLRNRLNAIESGDGALRELTREAKRLQELARETATQLTARRAEAAVKFANELTAAASPLGMKNLKVDINLSSAKLNPSGADAVEFRFAFNKNQEPMPVEAGASGGEISRLMLSIKSIIASCIELPSIIFDEIDTGVSGDVASRMGTMMQCIAESLQVIAITHLPAVAAKGKHHYKVYKEDDEQSTHTYIRALTFDERVDELATMLSGRVDDTTRAAARSLLDNGTD